MCRFRIAPLLSCLALVTLPTAALAAPLTLEVCTACHGSDGMGRSDPTYPVIAGMPAGHIEEAIFAYVDGARHCISEPRMCEAVAELSDSGVAEAAEYFAGQVRGPTHEEFDKELAAKGAILYQRHCAACHRPPHDEDVASAIGIPLHGQRSDYIRFAIKAYLGGDREALLEVMAHELRQLEGGDLDALVNYFSSYRWAE
jgi:cytochrome c553